jgi:dolichol phosphate-mannose biosynthesis regulatory protein
VLRLFTFLVLLTSFLCICDLATVLQPFVDTEVPVHSYFPDRYYAIAVPAVLLVLLLGFIGTFVSITMIKSSTSKKSS